MTSQLPHFRYFFTAGSWEKDTENRAAVTSLRPFLFRDDFTYVRFNGLNYFLKEYVYATVFSRAFLKHYCYNSNNNFKIVHENAEAWKCKRILWQLCAAMLSWTMSWDGCLLTDSLLPDKWKVREWK